MIPTLAAALAQQGYTDLTPVQVAVTEEGLEEQDLLVSAQTGSGKTVGFGLAIGPTLLSEKGQFGPPSTPLALIIAPTRELALQVKRELAWLYAGAGATLASCVGGMDFRDERRSLARGAHIVVATPGRLRDHIMRETIDLSTIKAIVLDEADEMLDLGFREDLEFILDQAPKTRRTLLFSATVPPMIVTLAKSYQKHAVRITTSAKETPHADITYRAYSVLNHETDAAIINTLRYYDAPNAIVFANTRAQVTRLTTRLSNRGFSVVALSGELTQPERTNALQAMRDGRARVCVATDVAARGIDLPNLDLVIHAELPTNAETLLHRSGRTGRAGRKGISALIVPAKMYKRAQNLLKWGKLHADWGKPPSADQIKTKDEERLFADPVWADDFSADEKSCAQKLLDRHSPETIAAAYVQLYLGRQSAPEVISDIPAGPDQTGRKQSDRVPFGPSRWFRIDIGRTGKAEARWLLPMLCKAGGISKRDIGAIRIQPNETFIEIAEPAVPSFLKSIGNDMRLENQASLAALDGPPQLGSRGPRKTKRDHDKPQATKDRPRAQDEPDDKKPHKPRKKAKSGGRKPQRRDKSGFKSDTKPGDAGGGNPKHKSRDHMAGTSKKHTRSGKKPKPSKGLGLGGDARPRRRKG